MAVVVIMPKQGQSVESCIVTEIKKKKGDTVKKGDILFSYETDKASFEEESPVDGVVLELSLIHIYHIALASDSE